MNLTSILTSAFLLAFINITTAQYNEAVDGDLSNDRLSPTPITLINGSNPITASSIGGEDDFFTITIPPGATLDAINLTAFSSSNVSFIAFQEGDIFSDSPAIPDLLGWTHLGLPLEDKLPVLAASVGTGAIGFDVPLPAGTYTFWSQETGSVPSEFTLDFVASIPIVPTLEEWAIINLALTLLIFSVISIQKRSQVALGQVR